MPVTSFITVPNFDRSITGGGCDPYVVVKMLFPEKEGWLEWMTTGWHIIQKETYLNILLIFICMFKIQLLLFIFW